MDPLKADPAGIGQTLRKIVDAEAPPPQIILGALDDLALKPPQNASAMDELGGRAVDSERSAFPACGHLNPQVVGIVHSSSP